MMKAIVIGGTGATGTALIDHLINDDEITEIISLVRNPERQNDSKVKEIKVDFDKLESYTEDIKGDIAFSCLGTTRKAAGGKDEQWKVDFEYNLKFAQLAKVNQIPRFALLSALGADPNAMIFYSKMKGKLEQAVKNLNFDHLVIARPSMLIRPNSDRPGERLGVSLLTIINTFGYFKKYQALAVDKVAKALLEASKEIDQPFKRIEVKEIKALAEQNF